MDWNKTSSVVLYNKPHYYAVDFGFDNDMSVKTEWLYINNEFKIVSINYLIHSYEFDNERKNDIETTLNKNSLNILSKNNNNLLLNNKNG